MDSKNRMWRVFVALEFALVLFFADTKVLLPATVFNTWFQSIFIGVGSILPVPFLLYWYYHCNKTPSNLPFNTILFIRSDVFVACAAVLFIAGLALCRIVAPLNSLPELIQIALVIVGSVMRGIGCTALFVALLENISFLPGRSLVQLAGIAILMSGLLDTAAYAIGNAFAFVCALVLAGIFIPLHIYNSKLLKTLLDSGENDFERIDPVINDGFQTSVFSFSGGKYAVGIFLLLTFLLSLLNPLLRTPLAILTQQGFSVEATRICTGLGFVLAGCVICILAHRITKNTSAPALSLVVIALCELFYLLTALFDGFPILTVLFCGIARKIGLLILFVVIAMQRRMVTSLTYSLMSISAAGFALLVSGCFQAVFSRLETDITGVVRSAILIVAFLLMTTCIIRFVGLHDAENPAATLSPTSQKPGFLDNKGLTDRENQIAMLLACGLSFNEIANNLYLSPSTIRVHASRIYAKCNVATQAEFVAAYYGQSLSQPSIDSRQDFD